MPPSLRRARARSALVVLVGALFVAPLSLAQTPNPCPDGVLAWVEACGASQAISLEARACPSGVVVVHAGAADAGLTVELSAASPAAFERAGVIGLSPVGSFPDWSAEPQERQDALAALVRCASGDQSLFGGPAAPVVSVAATRTPSGSAALPLPFPILPLLALPLSALLLLGARPLRRRETTGLLALFTATFALRWALLPQAFFHQNGQGPHWIRLALDDLAGLSAYGPGYAELFATAVHLAPEAPERPLFVAQALLGALIPLLAWALARALGAGAAAWAIALPIAASPLLGRLAQSESYFGAILVLLLAAGACAAAGTRPTQRWPLALGAAAAAGLFVAQAVRIHPLAWAPALTLPAIFLMGPRLDARAVIRASAQIALAGVVVAAASGAAIARVLQGSLSTWVPDDGLTLRLPEAPWLVALSAAALLALAHPRRARLLLIVGLAAGALLTEASANLLRNKDAPPYEAAFLWLFAPVLIGAIAALAGAWRAHAPHRFGALVTALSLTGCGLVLVDSRNFVVATDAREQAWALEWRATLPSDATVIYLGRAEERVLMLPIYRQQALRELPLRAGEALPALPDERTLYYYRSSLCSTPEGAEACARLEHELPLGAAQYLDLPPIASQPWHPLGPAAVSVSLHEVTGLPPR